ncbi:ovostatin isoform X2 [Pan troglodytes]
MFRVVSLDDHLKPVDEMYPVITLQDPEGNRIQQWVNEESVGGILQLSFQLISEPILGWYEITVEMLNEKKTYHSFSVEEYVLPKFQMTVDAPENILVVDSEFQMNVCALSAHISAHQENCCCVIKNLKAMLSIMCYLTLVFPASFTQNPNSSETQESASFNKCNDLKP